MGLFEGLFGSGPSQDITPQTTLTPEQEAMLKQLLGLISGDIGGEDQTFGIGASALETSSLAGLEALGSAIPGVTSPGSEAAQGAATAGLGALEQLFTQGPADIEEFFSETVQKPAIEAFNRDVIPGIRSRFAPQFFGGERVEAEARAGEDLTDALVRERARIGFQARQQQSENVLGGLTALPGAGTFGNVGGFQAPGAQANLLLGLLGGGGTQRNITQQQLDEAARRRQQGLGSLGVQGLENIVFNDPGSSGFIPELISSFTGSDAGSKKIAELIKF